MSVKPSLLRVFYKATEQRIKVFEGTPISSIIDVIKRSFHIDDDISKIFLQDEDGDLIVLPPKIPNGLCVYVYVEPSFIPKEKKLVIFKNQEALKRQNSDQSNSIPPPPNSIPPPPNSISPPPNSIPPPPNSIPPPPKSIPSSPISTTNRQLNAPSIWPFN